MKSKIWLMTVLILTTLSIADDASDWNDFQFTAVEKETIQKTMNFSNPSGAKHVVVDNVNGYIHVVGYNGSTVQWVAERTIQAFSKDEIEIAKKEVELKASEKNNTIEFYVDGPFRCNDRSVRFQSRRYRYRVTYNFELRVPRDSGLYLRTVNNGDIQVEGTSASYDIENINGKILMTDVSGSGHVYALNGGVKVLFTKNPSENSYFGSLNGNVDVAFRPGLSADLRFKTFNGNAYTDFPVTAVATPTANAEKRDGKFVYKSNRYSGARVGHGGPELRFDAFNGNIHLTER